MWDNWRLLCIRLYRRVGWQRANSYGWRPSKCRSRFEYPLSSGRYCSVRCLAIYMCASRIQARGWWFISQRFLPIKKVRIIVKSSRFKIQVKEMVDWFLLLKSLNCLYSGWQHSRDHLFFLDHSLRHTALHNKKVVVKGDRRGTVTHWLILLLNKCLLIAFKNS